MTMNQRLLRQVGHVLQGKLAPVARSITLSREPRNRRKQTQSIEILLNDDSISAFVKNEPKFQKTLLSLCYGCVCVILIMQDMCDDAYSAPPGVHFTRRAAPRANPASICHPAGRCLKLSRDGHHD
jgi:hypothetical protein